MIKKIAMVALVSLFSAALAAPVVADDWTMWQKKKTQKSLPAASYKEGKTLDGFDVDGTFTKTPFQEIPWLYLYHYLPSKEMESLNGMNKRFGKLFIFNDMDGWAGYGFYVAGNPSSSESYGDEVVLTLLRPEVQMVDTTKGAGRSFFNAWLRSQDEFRGARWGDDLMKDAYSKFAEVFGIDVIYYDDANSWLVVKNRAAVEQIVISKKEAVEWALAVLDDPQATEIRKAAALVACAKFGPDELEPRHLAFVNADMDERALRFIDENKGIMPKQVKQELYSTMKKIKNFFKKLKFW